MVSHWKLIKKKTKTKKQHHKNRKNFGPLPSVGIVKSHKGEDIPKTMMEIGKKRHERVSSHAMDAAPL